MNVAYGSLRAERFADSGAGVANSPAHPGKNVTGITTYAGTGIWGELLQLVRESSPKVERVAVA